MNMHLTKFSQVSLKYKNRFTTRPEADVDIDSVLDSGPSSVGGSSSPSRSDINSVLRPFSSTMNLEIDRLNFR
ncbi:hypothetical protein DPMN_137530 [Dreissena polymorpha]|uniref:Uncharacterized protein n=1 Tax=Dreissena polymorpha TaxID=45954 RepID=A0A9D4G200_DREPO|nr:hypothetical protein DPMN_137530 [Dreissena polymorpha]